MPSSRHQPEPESYVGGEALYGPTPGIPYPGDPAPVPHLVRVWQVIACIMIFFLLLAIGAYKWPQPAPFPNVHFPTPVVIVTNPTPLPIFHGPKLLNPIFIGSWGPLPSGWHYSYLRINAGDHTVTGNCEAHK